MRRAWLPLSILLALVALAVWPTRASTPAAKPTATKPAPSRTAAQVSLSRARPASIEPGLVPVRGRVIDEDGAPIGEARIEVRAFEHLVGDPTGEPEAETETDAG